MNFIVVGCGRVGSELSYRLFKSGHQVTAVDSNREAFNRLPPDFKGRTFEGEGLAESVLDRAGIKEAHGLAAVTNVDTLNAVVAYTAHAYYHVPVVVVRNYDPNLRVVIESFGLQIVSSTFWGAQRIEELLINPSQRVVYSAGNGEVEVYEMSIPEAWSGHTLGDLMEPLKQCYAVAITRAGHSSLPDMKVVLQSGDVINISSTYEGIREVTSRLTGKVEA